jgi:hypothetical protein
MRKPTMASHCQQWLALIPLSKSRRDTSPHSRGAIRPRYVPASLAKQRAWGMPGAQCTRSLACKVKKHTSIVTTGPPRSPGIPARNGFNSLYRALPGDRAFLSPSPALLLADLTPASRRQDHTTSPSAPVFRKSRSTVLVPVRRSFSEDRSAPLVLRRRRVHRIPHPRP